MAIRMICGRALPLSGRDIDTDRIMPARFLRAVTFDGLEQHLFADDRAAAARSGLVHSMDDPAHRGASVLVVESNFGCGSSREHAPQALRRAGFRAIVGESFGEIFRGNATMIGLACVTAAPAAMAAIFRFVQAHPETEVTIDLDEMTVTAGSFAAPIALPSEARTAFLTGAWDVTALLLERYAEVEQTAGRLRY